MTTIPGLRFFCESIVLIRCGYITDLGRDQALISECRRPALIVDNTSAHRLFRAAPIEHGATLECRLSEPRNTDLATARDRLGGDFVFDSA